MYGQKGVGESFFCCLADRNKRKKMLNERPLVVSAMAPRQMVTAGGYFRGTRSPNLALNYGYFVFIFIFLVRSFSFSYNFAHSSEPPHLELHSFCYRFVPDQRKIER